MGMILLKQWTASLLFIAISIFAIPHALGLPAGLQAYIKIDNFRAQRMFSVVASTDASVVNVSLR